MKLKGLATGEHLPSVARELGRAGLRCGERHERDAKSEKQRRRRVATSHDCLGER